MDIVNTFAPNSSALSAPFLPQTEMSSEKRLSFWLHGGSGGVPPVKVLAGQSVRTSGSVVFVGLRGRCLKACSNPLPPCRLSLSRLGGRAAGALRGAAPSPCPRLYQAISAQLARIPPVLSVAPCIHSPLAPPNHPPIPPRSARAPLPASFPHVSARRHCAEC